VSGQARVSQPHDLSIAPVGTHALLRKSVILSSFLRFEGIARQIQREPRSGGECQQPEDERDALEMTSGTVTTAVEVQLPLKVARRRIERVGFAYFSQRRQFLAPGGVERSDSDEKLEGVGEEVDISYLKSLDPKEWKDQDHYAILGLGKLR